MKKYFFIFSILFIHMLMQASSLFDFKQDSLYSHYESFDNIWKKRHERLMVRKKTIENWQKKHRDKYDEPESPHSER